MLDIEPDLLTLSGPQTGSRSWGLRNRWDLVKRLRDDTGNLDEERYVLYDAMDPVVICDENGDVKQRFEYSPFGEVTLLNEDFVPISGASGSSSSSSSSEEAPETWSWLFHGEFRDADTGYYNYGFRYYNDTSGRWISRDPIGESGGVNPVASFSNGPISAVDLIGAVPVKVDFNHTDPTQIMPVFEEGKISGTFFPPESITCSCKCECNEEDEGGDGMCYIDCLVQFSAWIRLSVEEAKRKGESLERVYGHEQRHVQSRVLRVQKIVDEMKAENGGPFKTKAKCNTSRSKWEIPKCQQIRNQLRRAYAPDHAHNKGATELSPVKNKGYAPIEETEPEILERINEVDGNYD
jgi:RHS repeat-associated protein